MGLLRMDGKVCKNIQRQRIFALMLAAMFFTLMPVGCASVNNARLSTISVEELEAQHRTVFKGTVLTCDLAGKKYLENYVYGTVPKRARVFATVKFTVDQAIKGGIQQESVSFKDVLVDGYGYYFQPGDTYLVAFDGSVGHPKNFKIRHMTSTSGNDVNTEYP